MGAPLPSSRRRRRRTPLRWTAELVARRPRLVLAIWIVVLGGLALPGLGVVDKVSSSPIFVDGSETEREHEVATAEFGSDSPLIVMLRGPRAELDRQGPVLARRLAAMPAVLVNSPWDGGRQIPGLSPTPDIATLTIGVGVPPGLDSETAIERIEERVRSTVSAPLEVNVAGGLPLAYALRDSANDAAEKAELLAIPVLLIVLLLVCRSLIAAAMPIVIGAFVVAATKGVLFIFSDLVTVQPFALSACGMMGLALGVDYALSGRLQIPRGAGGERRHRHRGGADRDRHRPLGDPGWPGSSAGDAAGLGPAPVRGDLLGRPGGDHGVAAERDLGDRGDAGGADAARARGSTAGRCRGAGATARSCAGPSGWRDGRGS